MSTITIAPSRTATVRSPHRDLVAAQRHAEAVAAADADLNLAAAALWDAVAARLAVAGSISKATAAVGALMLHGAVQLFKRSNGVLKVVFAAVIFGMVADIIAYPTAAWAAIDGWTETTFGLGAVEVAAVIPPQVTIGYVAILAAAAFSAVGVTTIIRKRTAH